MVPLAQSLAVKHARTPTDVDDLTQEALWALVKAWRRTPRPAAPFAFAKTVMRRAVKGYYHSGLVHPVAQADVDVIVPVYLPRPDDRLELDAFLTNLTRTHGIEARIVAENLLSPITPAVCERILGDHRRKQRQRSRGRKQVRGVATVRITHQHIREALGMSRSRWDIMLTSIREFTREWLGRT